MVSYIWQLSETLRSNGFAAMGTLMTVTLKREDDSTGDSLLRRELPTGLRDGDGSAAGWTSTLKSQISNLSSFLTMVSLILMYWTYFISKGIIVTLESA